jgi:hypothetical protein
MWIWTADDLTSRKRVDVRYCTAEFDATENPVAHVNISADCRYVLWLNGVYIGRGPARSDLDHYVYDTHDVTLRKGKNRLAVLVHWYDRESGPLAEIHAAPGLIAEVQNSNGDPLLWTAEKQGWKILRDKSLSPRVASVDGYYAVGTAEDVRGADYPHGWQIGEVDQDVVEAVRVAPPCMRNEPGDQYLSWRLMPRDIPQPRHERRQFAGQLRFPITIPANETRKIVIDAGVYAIGFPVLVVSGGAGAAVEVRYSEALFKNGKKQVRDDPEGDVIGLSDIYRPGGGNGEEYTPLHWRAFRFVALEVATGSSALTINRFEFDLTGYPWLRDYKFVVENGPTEIPAVLDTDFRTLGNCTYETFMDCPYYEQLQYVGDARLQALLSYVTTGDTRLGARACRLFDWSRTADGLTYSRYPSNQEQVIPTFSLIWIQMLEDLYQYAPGEGDTVRNGLLGARGVLDWYLKFVNANGVVGGKLPWWQFVDWCFPRIGVPDPVHDGAPSAAINLQFLAAIQSYVRLLAHFGTDRDNPAAWSSIAEQLKTAIIKNFWRNNRLMESTDDKYGATQHAQAWGILTDAIPRAHWNTAVSALNTDEALTPATYYQTFYVIEALAKAGRLENLWTKWLSPWRDALSLHLTTWPECPEPTRSDCHAWSAWPTFAFLTHVLGVGPTSPGFASYAIEPKHVEGWEHVMGRIKLPQGVLRVNVVWNEDKPTIKSSLVS